MTDDAPSHIARRDGFSFLENASRQLAGSLDYEQTIATLASFSLPWPDAWCIVDVVFNESESEAADAVSHIKRAAVLHGDASKQSLANELHRKYPTDEVLGGAARAIRTGRCEVMPQVSDAALVSMARDAAHLALLRALGTEAYVVAPMISRHEVIGAITFVTARGDRPLGDDDVLFAEDLARRAAMAVDNARLRREALRARDDADALAQALREARAESQAESRRSVSHALHMQALAAMLSEATTEDEVAQAIVSHATALLGAAAAAIARVMPGREQIEIMSIGPVPEQTREEWHRFPLSASTPLSDVARSGEPLFIESRDDWFARYPHLVHLADEMGHRANAVMPLVVGGDVIGVLGAAFEQPRTFAADDRALAAAVAQQCAQALERARLLQAERDGRRDAEAATSAKSRFLAAMSHELRTPLNAIGGYAQLLEMGLYGPVTTEQRGVLGRVQLAQTHLLRLVNDVLNFERMQAGRLEFHVRPVRLVDVIADVEPLIRPQLQAKGLTYTAEVPDDCVVRADPEKLGQVLLNLLSNAAKFTPAGGQVHLERTTRKDRTGDVNTVYLRVSDTGVGVPRDQVEAIFEPFVQVTSTLAGRTDGAGLGLAISRDLARGMGGDLRVRSKPGEGTAFTVALPRG